MARTPETTLSADEEDAADKFVSAARRLFGERLARIILYGSRARGEGHSESDLDLLLLLRCAEGVDWHDARAVSFLAADVGLETGIDVSAKCVSLDRFEREAAEPAGFASRVSRDGITLWQAI